MPAPTAPSPGFGEHLRERREALNMLQADAARSVGVSQATWSEWESGKQLPRGERLTVLERIFGVDPDVWMSTHMQGGGRSISRKRRTDHLLSHLQRCASQKADTALATHVPHSWATLAQS